MYKNLTVAGLEPAPPGNRPVRSVGAGSNPATFKFLYVF